MSSMKPFFCCVCIMLNMGCVWSFETARLVQPKSKLSAIARDDNRCRAIDNEKNVWTVVSTGLGIIAGGNGITAIPVDDKDIKAGVLIGASIAGLGSAITGLIAAERANAWVRDCSQ